MDLNTCFELAGSLRSLALYSHLLPSLVVVLLSVFVLRNSNKRSVTTTTFVLFSFLLALWLMGDLAVWHLNDYHLVAAFWSTLDYINILFYLVLFCFFFTQVRGRNDLPYLVTIIAILLSTVPLLITISGLAVGEFDQTNCEMAGNDFLALYKLGIEWLSIISIFILGSISAIRSWNDKKRRSQVLVLTLSTVFFLAIFSGSEYLATFTDIYEINLYALFSLPVFLVILTFSITEQGTFDLKKGRLVLEKLLFTIFILVASFGLTLTDDKYELGVAFISAIVTFGFGILLLRSARREVKQREQIEVLAQDLARANVRLEELDKAKSEFVSIASHQLRSPLTSIRGYASMLAEGSFGKMTQKAQEAAARIEESAKLMAMSVEDYLNVSRIESGNMKYNLSDFNLRDMTDKICEDLRPDAMKHNLILLFRTNLNSRGIVNADIGKTNQIINNLINNSVKYTPKGTINVFMRDDVKKKKIYVEITDTGIGMSQETINKLFNKFTRADNANSVNVSGTGLGLFVAFKMAEAMGGTITAQSEGDNKGSTFTFELPLQM